MFKNYLLVSIRNLLRNKVYSTINILGLVISIAASILVFSYFSYETSFDKFFRDSDNIYRVSLTKYQDHIENVHSALTYTALSTAIKENFPEVIASTRISKEECLFVYDNEKKFGSQKVFWVDQSFFNVFSINFINGSAREALSQPNTAVITKEAAERFFGNDNPVGKTLLLNEGLPFLITAEVENLPTNSHLSFDFLLSLSTGYSLGWVSETGDWMFNWVYTYIKVNKHFNQADFEARFNEYTKKNDFSQSNPGAENKYQLQPLKSIHLDSDLSNEITPNGNRKLIYAMALIAIFILVIAWINFINLCTARAIERAKETGIRKVSGAEKSQLIGQFLFESLMINLIAGIIAFLLAKSLMPYFSDLLNKPLNETIWTNTPFWLMYIVLFIVGSVISGIYPSLVLSGFQPMEVLKSRTISPSQGNMFRKILVVFQFTVTIVLITATLVIYMQFRKMRTAGTGVNTSQVLVLKAPPTLNMDPAKKEKFLSFKEQVKSFHSIKEISASNPIPGQEVNSHNEEIKRLSDSQNNHQTFSIIQADNSFIPLYNLKLIAGDNFSFKSENDSNNLIINKKATVILGFQNTASAIGEKISIEGHPFTIKGIIEDYYQEGLKKQVTPTIIFHDYNYIFGYYSVKIDAGNMQESIALLQQKWDENFPKDPFEYFFCDEVFAAHYEQEQQAGKVFAGFTILALVIACLGLFGLISYLASRRTKELGLRKVLGATGIDLFILLAKDFASLIGVAVLIGFPIAYFVMDAWLSNYPVHITLNIFYFLVPILALVVSALIVSGYAILKATYSNPVNALRYE